MRRNKPKFEKLEKGERRAVRQSGAMKEARTTGIKTNIYSGDKGGLMGYKANNEAKPILRKKSTTSAGTAVGGSTSEATKIKNAEIYNKQSMINQKEFEKTRLGQRMLKKSEKAKEKGKFGIGSDYRQATPKTVSEKKQIKVAGATKGGKLKSDLKPTLAEKREARRIEKQKEDVKRVKNKRGL